MDESFLEAQMEHKFAPVPLLAVQGLVNTIDFEKGEDVFGDEADAEGWLKAAGLLESKAKVHTEGYRELLELRAALREMLEAATHGNPDSEPGRDLRRLAERHPTQFEVGSGGSLRLASRPASEPGELVGQLIGIVAQAQDRGWWDRLKVCASEECRWAFYDASKNRGGTWCRMEVCGNRTKNRRYRARSS